MASCVRNTWDYSMVIGGKRIKRGYLNDLKYNEKYQKPEVKKENLNKLEKSIK